MRAAVEKVLIEQKDLIATLLQRLVSKQRTSGYESLLDSIIKRLVAGEEISQEWLVETAGLKGKVLTGEARTTAEDFSETVKSKAFIRTALEGAPCCAICKGYLDADKSISYDHTERKRDGGKGGEDNLQLCHPFCNQGYKN